MAEGNLAGLSAIVVSQPFRIVIADAVGTVTAIAAVTPNTINVKWSLSSTDPLFVNAATVGTNAVMASVTCRWSLGVDPNQYAAVTGTVSVNSSFTIPVSSFAAGVPTTVAIACVDGLLNRVVSGYSNAFTIVASPPLVIAAALTQSWTDSSLPSQSLSPLTQPSVQYTQCGANGGPATTAVATAWAFAANSLGTVSLALGWAGAVTDVQSTVASFTATLSVNGVAVGAPVSCGASCVSASFPIAPVWAALHPVDSSCVAGAVTLTLAATSAAGLTGSATTGPLMFDVTAPGTWTWFGCDLYFVFGHILGSGRLVCAVRACLCGLIARLWFLFV